MLIDDAKEIAVELIEGFGTQAYGFLITKTDFSALGGSVASTTEEPIKYFYELFGSAELVDGRILSGDAKLYTYVKATPNQDFKDSGGQIWHIKGNFIDEVGCQDGAAYYISQIRK